MEGISRLPLRFLLDNPYREESSLRLIQTVAVSVPEHKPKLRQPIVTL
jgi:hypothetical protein